MRRNPDNRTRDLERRVAGGDTEAVEPLIRALERAGGQVPYDLRAQFFVINHAGDNLVTYPNGKQRKVTNLGWLRRQLHRGGGSLTGRLLPLMFVVRTNVAPFPGECYLRVELSDGAKTVEGDRWIAEVRESYAEAQSLGTQEALAAHRDREDRRDQQPDPFYVHTHTYETMFASCHHLWDWLQTPLFENEPIDWDGHVGRIELRMHESTYGHPAESEGGPNSTCHRCGMAHWDDRLPSGHEDYDDHEGIPDRGIPLCPTCKGTLTVTNPGFDQRRRGFERAAAGGDVEASARAIVNKVRSGEIPRAHVRLAGIWTGRHDALMADPPPHDYMPGNYLQADRRDLVRWALELDAMLPRRENRSDMIDMVRDWLVGGKRPPSIGPSARPWGRGAIVNDASRIIRARSDRGLHELTRSVIKHYQIAVSQRFMDEIGGRHGSDRLSPAWNLRLDGTPVVKVSASGVGPIPLTTWDDIDRAAERQATDLLGRILLHEE